MKRITFTIYGMNGKTTTIPAYRIPQTPEDKGLQLVAHKALGDKWRGTWTVAEESTSFSIGRGPTREVAIENAKQNLAKRTPDQIAAGMRHAKDTVNKFKAESRIELLDSLSGATA